MSDQEKDNLSFKLGEVSGTVNSLVLLVSDMTKRLHDVEKKLWYVCGGSVLLGVFASKIDWLGLAVKAAQAASQ
jgi:hypothetical protein